MLADACSGSDILCQRYPIRLAASNLLAAHRVALDHGTPALQQEPSSSLHPEATPRAP